MWFKTQRAGQIAQQLKGLIAVHTVPVTHWQMKEGFFLRPSDADAAAEPWQDFDCQTGRWGGYDKHCWFRAQVTIPAEMAGYPVDLVLSTDTPDWDATNPQMLIFLNGQVTQGADQNHREIRLTDKAAGQTVTVDVQAYAGLFDQQMSLSSQLCAKDMRVKDTYYDLQVAAQTAAVRKASDHERIRIENMLQTALNMLDLRAPYSPAFYGSLVSCSGYLKTEFYNHPAANSGVTVGIGHTHIDVGWLWTVEQTREKAARSFSTVLKLMEQYPDYRFMSSQPVLYKMVKQRYPELFEKIKERVKEGRWEPEGGMWLEADTNVPSGESLVRQFLHGKAFFKNEFGVDSQILWLPDVFGYSAALPQICKKCGIDSFMTTKITWNQINKFPYDTFLWRGIDGTEILTHFGTATDAATANGNTTTYNAQVNPSQVKGTFDRYQQKEINDRALMSFGFGDGGGGPTAEMLENAKRLSTGVPGMPQFEQQSMQAYFEQLHKTVDENPNLPTWVGELYLEFHRGTYTSMARNKKSNRKCEILLQDAEFFSVFASQFDKDYPAQQLHDSWETVLLNQFHDILPGSAIRAVYDVTKKEYEALEKDTKALIDEKLAVIASHADAPKNSVLLFNTLSFERSDVVILPKEMVPTGGLQTQNGEKVPVQKTANGDFAVFAQNIPAKGWLALESALPQATVNPFAISDNAIDTPFYRVAFNAAGQITSLFDKQQNREVLRAGARGNVLKVFENKPMAYDNWDIDIYYTENSWEVDNTISMQWTETGPVRATLHLDWDFSGTPISQDIRFYAHSRRIDFETKCDWKLSQFLLKAEFPVDINASSATYDIQFGNLQRPTHFNTSWDMARFEVCAHKWADLSEGDYGVSLLNDCKYGYDIHDSVMRITLIKAGVHPQVSDIEAHAFTYSLYPHAGGWQDGEQENTVRAAYALNVPVYPVLKTQNSDAHAFRQYLKTDSDHVVVETVKQAEDQNGVIVRLYEYQNKRGSVRIDFALPVEKVFETDLLEQNPQPIPLKENAVTFTIKPYEIKTLRVIPRG